MQARRFTDYPHLTFGSFHAVLEQTIEKNSHRDENPNGRASAGLVYIVSGKVQYIFHDRTLTVRAGDVLFLPRGGKYAFDVGDEDYRYIFVNFDFVEDDLVLPEVFRLRGDRPARCFHELLKTYDARPPEYREECMLLLYMLYACVQKHGPEQYVPNAKRESIEKAASYIRTHYREPETTVQEAASISGISLTHFRRLFSKIYSVSPQEYMLDLRIDAAKNLLSTSMLSVGEVAEACGFSSSYYFSRFFHIKTGLSPTEYRNKYKDG